METFVINLLRNIKKMNEMIIKKVAVKITWALPFAFFGNGNKWKC